MSRKTACIITMHKVKNYGSALQAWALQETLRKMNIDACIIDYLYPNQYYFDHVPHTNVKRSSFLKKITLKKIVNYIKTNILYSKKKQDYLFEKFWDERFNLTKTYTSPEELKNDPPHGDYYITGSDQVWNPNTMYADPSFFLDFGSSEIPRIAYASSFGTNVIPEAYYKLYQYYLSRYASLGIRELIGVQLANSLSGKDSCLVCDPTLLLKKDDYAVLAKESTVEIRKPYLLAYILDYAYNPYPAIDTIIEQVSKKMGLHVVYLLCGNTNGYKIGSTTISAAGPNEFVNLFRNASFVVTSSFHGTVFSLIHEKQFYSVLPSHKSDSRIASLLSKVGLLQRGISASSVFKIQEQNVVGIDYAEVNSLLDQLRSFSLNYLHLHLNC